MRFTIKDNGIGMKPEYKDKIFDAFSREEKGATKTIQGTGLGMAITKSLVELMGGTIRVESEEGKGSTFTVNLRLQVVETNYKDAWDDLGVTIFLGVNNNGLENQFFMEHMKKCQLTGEVVMSGNAALATIEDYLEKGMVFDFITVDDSIEDMTLSELIKKIRAKEDLKNAKIVAAVSQLDMVDDELKAAGASMVIQKPVREFNMRQALEELAEADKKEEEAANSAPANPLQGLKFLAAEDNDINADILIELMDMEGATVTRGVNGQEVVEMFKNANEGDYDMILMDIQMPVMNGYEAAAAIRALGTDWSQRIPIIAMTANAYADDVQQAFDAGMNAHVTKPIDIRIVEKTILEFKK